VFTSVLGRAQPTTAHVNAGISGTGPEEYLALGRAWISAVRPDLVVTFFFVGNDIDRSWPHTHAAPWSRSIRSMLPQCGCVAPRPEQRLPAWRTCGATSSRVRRLWLSASLPASRNSLGISWEP
jgi:hypothetical protein